MKDQPAGADASARSRVVRGIVAAVGATLIAGSLVSAGPTVAAWQDPTIAEGALSAKVLVVPTGSCAYITTTSERSFSFTWRFPAGSGYNLTNVRFVRATSLTDSTLVQLPAAAYSSSGPNTAGNYTTIVNASRSVGYFDGMYSDTTAFRLGLRSTEGGWTSQAATATVRLSASSAAGTCAG